ncbi:MAG: hypothetical protein ACRCST_14925 [Turicibacter sp.]
MITIRLFQVEDTEMMYLNWVSDEEVTKNLLGLTHSSIEMTKGVLRE